MTGTSSVPTLSTFDQAERSPALEDLHLLDSGYSLDDPKALSPAQFIASISEPGITSRKLNAMRTEYLARRQQASQTEQLEERQLTETVERAGGLMYFSIDPSRKAGSYFFAETPTNRPLRRIIHLPDDFPIAKKRRVQEDEEVDDEVEMEMDTSSSGGRSQSVSSAEDELIVSRVATPHEATPQPPSSGVNGVPSTSTSNTRSTMSLPSWAAPSSSTTRPTPPVDRRAPAHPYQPVAYSQPTPTTTIPTYSSSSFPSYQPPIHPSRLDFFRDRPFVAPSGPPPPPAPPHFAQPTSQQPPYFHNSTPPPHSQPIPSPSTFGGPSNFSPAPWSATPSYPPVYGGPPPFQNTIFHPPTGPPIAPQPYHGPPNPYAFNSNPYTRLPNPYALFSNPIQPSFNPYHPSPSLAHSFAQARFPPPPTPPPPPPPLPPPPPSAATKPPHIPSPPSSIRPLLKLLLERQVAGDLCHLASFLGGELKKLHQSSSYKKQSSKAETLGYIVKSRSSTSMEAVQLIEGTVSLNPKGKVVAGYRCPQPPPPPPPPKTPVNVKELPPLTPSPNLRIFLDIIGRRHVKGEPEMSRSALGGQVAKLGETKQFKSWMQQAEREKWIHVKQDEVKPKQKSKGNGVIGLTKRGLKCADSRTYTV